MKFSEAISGPIFAADAPDITVVASSSADINITVVCSDTKWQLTMTPVSSSDGYTAVIRTKEILASLVEPRGIDAPDGAVPEIAISANNGAEPEISMSFQTLYGSAAGKTPVYMARHWLTWRDQVSQTLLEGRERLTFVAGLNLLGWQSGTYKVAAKIYKSSGSVSVGLASGALAEEANYYAIDASLSTIAAAASLAESAVLAYDMSFSLSGTDSTGTAATLQSYPLRMVVTAGETRLKEFAFINSFGVEDRVISYGATQSSLSGGSSTFVNRGSEQEISNDAQSQWEVQSGRIASSRGAELWSEFLQSAQRYLATSGAMSLIVIDEFDTDISEGELSSVSFKYHLGEQIKGSYFEDDESIGEYDPAQKYGALVVGDVPEAVTPPSEDLFFLKTRLDDFPLVSLSENYLFLVQSPVSYHWGAASLKSIKNWLQGVVQEDIKGITEDLYGLHKALEEAMSAIDAEMDEMEDAISRMNDDTVFNMSEKGQIRTLWENINGIASLVDVGAGTYQQALQLAEESGATAGEQTEITFNKNRLLFSGEALRWWVSGVSALEAAFYSLRDYLIDVNLYLNTDTAGFDREHLASLFTAYYRAEQSLVAYAQSCYATGILQNFIQGEYKEDLEAVNSQLDKKAETWYQSSAPSLEWDTDKKRAEHLGDIWLNTTADANGNTHAYVYRLKDGAYGWEELNGVPEDVFDMADGKASIYVSKPSSYKKNDLWILESAYTLDGTSYAAGTIVVAVRDGSSWSAADWAKRDRYTDDSALTTFIDGAYAEYKEQIQTQLDSKAETWYQATDPSAAWTTAELKAQHKGDIWRNTSSATVSGVESGLDAIWNGSSWDMQSVPSEVYDKIDGKAAIYVEWGSWGSGLRVKDIFIPAADTTQSGVAYKKDAFYRCTATNPATFEELKYTDDSALADFLNGDYSTYKDQVQTQLDSKAETWYQATDPSTAWTTYDVRNEHLGDIWLNTTADANGNTHAYVYRLKDGAYGWEELNGVPEDVFDMADGKASIYVSKPSSYKKNDLWILESAYTLDGASYAAGTIVVAVRDASSWSAADWAKRDRYTDDSALNTFISDTYTPYAAEVGKQLDAKANTYAQSSDPATAWASTEAKELHIGDLWLNTSKSSVSGVGSMKTAIYTKSGSTYGWVVSDVPNELFDDIDGKSSIYVAQPTSYNARDMWILEADRTLNGTAYRKGTILIATTTSQSFNAAHWVKRDAYIDTADLKSAVDDIDGELTQLKAGLEEINDDTILDTSEKGYIRTSWEAVNGLATTDQVGTDGSYTKTKAIVEGVGATDETVSLTFAKVAMTYNGVTIDWHYTGVAELDTAFLSLRQFLRDVNLYSNINKTSFDREEMAQLFTRYYDAVQNLLDRAQKKYTDDGIGDVKQSINDFISGEYSEYKKDVQTQLDSKAETWYQATDPSAAWTTAELKAQHKGDIWRNTSSATVSGVESGLDAIWNGSSWDMQSVPSEVYDKIDGKAAIYVEWGSWGSGLRVKDIFIPAADTTQSGVTYKKDAFYRCTATNPATFEELKYTDDSALADFDYLKQAMTDGAATEIGEGVVLSQVIGVKDAGTDNIVAGMNGSSTIEALNDADKGRLMFWAGSKNVAGAKDAVTKIWENGEVESSKFKAISGTFRTLICVDNEGNVMGAIRFDSSGSITFEGDLYMQGSVSSRNGRFRMNDVWVRGSFGSAERNTLKIVGSTAYFYTKGVSKTPVTVALESIQTTQDVTVYKVPGYFISSGATGTTEGGFPVDTIVFGPITGTYYYELELSDTQRVLLVNAKDDTTDNSVYVYSNGSAVLLTGGVVREAIKLETFLNPTVASTTVGAGLLLGAEYDNTWH